MNVDLLHVQELQGGRYRRTKTRMHVLVMIILKTLYTQVHKFHCQPTTDSMHYTSATVDTTIL